MKFTRLFSLAALALAATMGLGSRSEAAYTYSTSITITSVGGVNTPGVGATVTSANGTTVSLTDILTPGLFLVGSPLSPNIANIGVNTTSSVPDSFTVGYTDVVTITNPSPGGSTGTFTINGTLTLTAVQTSGGASGGTVSNVYSGTLTQTASIGGVLFTVSFGNGTVNNLFAPPTVNNPGGVANGSLGALITSSAVPEPASMALLGLGLAGVAGVGAYRRRLA